MAASKFSVQSFDLKHYAKTEAYARAVQALFDSATRDIMRMKQVGTFDPNKPFSWNDYPQAKAEMDKITLQLATRVVGVIERGSREEWLSSCKKNDAWLDSIMDTSKLSKEHLRQFQDRRLDALQAFQERKVGGLDLSQRVWKYVAQYKENLEDGIDLGLGKGTSADVLSREVRQYLRDPDMYFRRFRVKVGTDESGQTIYGRKWKRMVKTADGVRWIDEAPSDYHPGQGVYRSSYKNAMRLTRSEINMAYRESDWQRWQQLDFVVGFEIHRSNHEPQFKCKLCDRLTGRYPKNFRFIGWHPQCRCYVTPIIADRETFNSNELSDLKAALRGGTAQHQQAKNAVVKMPDNFTQWAEETAAKVAAGEMSIKSTPYFIRDNFTAGDIMQGVKPEVEQYNPLLSMSEAQNIVEMARKRHAARTQQEIDDIKKRWEEHNKSIELTKKQATNILKVAPNWVDVDASELAAAVASGNVSRMKSATQNVVAQIKRQQSEERALSDIIPNAHSLHQSYSMSELQSAYKELDGVLKKWLSKYNYSSLDAAPLQHLKNKLDFELTNPTINYSQRDIIKKAISEKILLIDKQIEWNDMVSRAATLKTFKTRSNIFKDSLAKIEDAIQRNDFDALQRSIAEAEKQQQKILDKQIKRGGDIKSALNKEYKGGATGKDITSSFNTARMKSEDPYNGTFTNNAARMQGFDAPAKLVSESEFAILEKACGDVFYRTVNPTTFKGKRMSSAEFAAQLYEADLLELNGPGGRVHGDGMYVATSAWDGRNIRPLSDSRKQRAYDSSECYGDGRHTLTEMTWTRMPKIIKASELRAMWSKLSAAEQARYGNHRNTYGCALGYDAMYCDGVNYMVIWNRSIIAVKKR